MTLFAVACTRSRDVPRSFRGGALFGSIVFHRINRNIRILEEIRAALRSFAQFLLKKSQWPG
jgi:hypothetical protein